MGSSKENLDVLGTYLRASKDVGLADRIVFACGRLGGNPRLTQVFEFLGMSEDDFAKAVGEAESRGFVRREKTNNQVNLTLTGLGRQFWEQSIPQ